MTTLILWPGNLACEVAGLRGESDHRMIFRSFINTLFWGTISIGAALILTNWAGL